MIKLKDLVGWKTDRKYYFLRSVVADSAVITNVAEISGPDCDGDIEIELNGYSEPGAIYVNMSVLANQLRLMGWTVVPPIDPCKGCDCPAEQCRQWWPQHKKCCPDCKH